MPAAVRFRRGFAGLLAAGLLAASTAPAAAQSGAGAAPQPPHAWLFGTWTGGLFPAPSRLTAEACLGEPVVIFTRDIVMRATLLEQSYIQRLIETARTGPGFTEIRFLGAPAALGSGLFGAPQGPQSLPGFGCEVPDTLLIQRVSDNEIRFPGCADFPNPLIRCPGR